MPLEGPFPEFPTVADRAAELNKKYRHHSAIEVLRHALKDDLVGRVTLVSSFGAESVVLLHMISLIDRTTPVLFLDTEMLFPETLEYQRDLSKQLGLEDVRVIRPDAAEVAKRDPDGTLNKRDADACCMLRKTEPLNNALKDFDTWITGRKRFQTASRATLEFFEEEAGIRIKINPLAHWTKEDVQDYILNNRLPRHPLVEHGYPSIGCMPCTSRVGEGEDERAGRWRAIDKDECGIHFIDGRIVRGPAPAEPTHLLVTDSGFRADDWADFEAGNVLELPADTDPLTLSNQLHGIDLIRVDFPSFADGRGFTIARQLRLMGYRGRLRARGHLISDQYAMARRSGFDEVEISKDLAKRQPQEEWVFRANWKANDYQARLRG